MAKEIDIPLSSKILITGGTGLVGRALTNTLKAEGFTRVFSVGSNDCDFRNGMATERLMDEIKPDYLFHLAARVYGLGGNSLFKSDILFENVLINTNVIEYARRIGVKKVVAMGSGCVYPELKGQEQLFEHQLWSGPPHKSEDSYAHSKRLMLAQLNAAKEQYEVEFAFAISGNLYGPYDSFNTEEGHVIPSLIAKFYDAAKLGKPVSVWGSGIAIRDFMHSNDVANALISILRNSSGALNMGSGQRHQIRDIVETLHQFTGVEVDWDSSKPDGQIVRYYNLDRLNGTGFKASINLVDGLRQTYEWYSENWQTARK